MTNKERLQDWFEAEKAENNLVDIKFFRGETSTSSENSLCGATLIALEQDKLGNSIEIEEL
jgi:hypothetical protein